MKSTILTSFAVAAVMMTATSVFGQLNLTNNAPYNTSTYLIQNVFMSNGINAFNVSYNGVPNGAVNTQVGYFTGGGNLFGIDTGIVMTTGAIAPINTNGNIISTAYTGSVGDADVLAVAQSVGWGTPPTSVYDRAILEFYFVAPQNDSVSFEYCFASEEWPIYPCSFFNDAFGFFIKGPGITGPYMGGGGRNVAIVPGTANLPVSITSIHNGTGGGACSVPSFPQYYNTGPTPFPFAFAGSNAGNGNGAFTDVFMTKAVAVQACDTYHVKLAICDGSDRIFDSAVFLKAKSFEFRGITVSSQPTYNPFGFDTALYEGCGDLELTFNRVDTVFPPYTMSYYIAGTATMGLDYANVSGCTLVNGVYDCGLYFPQDSTTVTLNIPIFYDNIAEGIESFLFIIDDPNVTMCGDDDTMRLSIVDQPDLQISTFGNTTLDCNSPPAAIGVTVQNGLPPYTYQWSNNVTTANQSVQPNVTTAYTVQVTDACGYQVETGVVTVGVFNVPWSMTKLGDKQTISCISSPVNIGVQVQFNDGIWHGDIHYLWSTGSTSTNINVFSTVDTTYTVTVSRGCTGETQVLTFDLYVKNDPVVTYTEDIDQSKIKCPGDFIEIGVNASGGYPPYTYVWDNALATPLRSVNPLETHTYYVTVTDVCGLAEYTDSVVVNVPVAEPLVIRGVADVTVPCEHMKAHFGPAVPSGGFGWGYELSWTNFNSFEDYMQQIIWKDTSFTVKLTDGCHADTVEKTVFVTIADHSDLALMLTKDTTICYGDVLKLVAHAEKGGGEYKYFWNGSKTASGSTLTINPTKSSTYTVRMTDFCDTARTASVKVDVSSIAADFDYEYIDDYVVVLTDHSWSTDSIKWYEWDIPAAGVITNERSPQVTLPDGAAYETTLEVTNKFDCMSRTTVPIKPEYHLYIPTSFSPNSDGKNEVWSISSLGIKEFKLEIYNRWGEKLFETTDKNFQWDGTYRGTKLPMGTYAWRLVLFTDHDEYVHREGAVLLMNDFEKPE